MKPAARRSEEQERRRESGYQLKLGNKSLLAMFLALATVCGMFFAFGYTLGKHAIPATFRLGSAPVANAAQPSGMGGAPAPAAGVLPPNAQALGAAEADQTPSTLTPNSPPSPGGANGNGTAAGAAGGGSALAAAAAANPPASSPAQTLGNVPANAAGTPPAKLAAGSSGVYQVQVFAGVQADASNLATALKAKGYPANVVPPGANASDDYYRVEVGPYLTSAEAQAMRSRLTADGYQAVIKQ